MSPPATLDANVPHGDRSNHVARFTIAPTEVVLTPTLLHPLVRMGPMKNAGAAATVPPEDNLGLGRPDELYGIEYLDAWRAQRRPFPG